MSHTTTVAEISEDGDYLVIRVRKHDIGSDGVRLTATGEKRSDDHCKHERHRSADAREEVLKQHKPK
jgi:hypothetical protein